jgi:hypothetical protein
MGLVLLLFNHEAWKELYSTNCSFYTPEEWNAKGSPNVLMGTLYLSIGVFCQVSIAIIYHTRCQPEQAHKNSRISESLTQKF